MHETLARTSLNAYDWTDLEPNHNYIIGFDVKDEGGEALRTASERKKSLRYRGETTFATWFSLVS